MSLAGLEALRQRFIARCRDERAVVQAWLADGLPRSEGMEHIIHNMAGAAGTFGFPGLHAAAAVVDDRFALAQDATPAEVEAILDAIDALPPAQPAE